AAACKTAAKQVIREAVNAIENLDFDNVRSLACHPSRVSAPPEAKNQKPEFELDIGEPNINRDRASVPVKGIVTTQDGTATLNTNFQLRKKDREWCLDNGPSS